MILRRTPGARAKPEPSARNGRVGNGQVIEDDHVAPGNAQRVVGKQLVEA